MCDILDFVIKLSIFIERDLLNQLLTLYYTLNYVFLIQSGMWEFC